MIVLAPGIVLPPTAALDAIRARIEQREHEDDVADSLLSDPDYDPDFDPFEEDS